MQILHIALAVKDLEEAICEYSRKFACEPTAIASKRYALWRTDSLNISITQIPDKAGQLRHLGFESQGLSEMYSEHDNDGIEWEYFTAEQQRQEIMQYYPDADYPESKL